MGIVENTYAELKQQELKNNPYSCLHMADIDINPHQVEAFTFALSSLELGGAILADEVGLGKTIEAGLVIKYLLCSGKNKILLIMPSNLRKQWQVELEEKFDIDSLIVDSSNWEDYLEEVKSKQAVIIVSYHFASKRKTEFGKIAWDFCVFDEAHRLRNVYKNGSKMANSLYELTKGIPKILLTATPMQNTLLDIYGLVQFIDDRVFYSKQIFSERYLRGEDYNDLKACLEPVVQRTLRKEVAEYIQFSERKEMTIDFELSPMEIELYVMINNYLKKEILYALPNSHRTLITSVIRKLLASSSMAVAETFKVLKGRLETLKETTRTESADESIDFFLSFFDDDEIETDDDSKQDELYTRESILPTTGELIAENEKVRLCVIQEREREEYLAVSYEHSFMKSAFKDNEFTEDLWNNFLSDKMFVCTVFDWLTGGYVGYCAIKNLNKPDWELGIELKKEWCHKGYGTEAVSLFLKKVATLTGKRFFRARVDIENVASQAMMRKLGAYPNGVSEFLLHGQLLEEFKSENIDKIDDNIRNIACEFKMTPEDILGYVLEYRIDVEKL